LTWCDKLASTPAIGFRFEPHYQSATAILQAMSPLLDKWAKRWTQGFNIERQTSFELELTTEDGFQYVFDARRMAVEFRHRLKIKAQSGGPPSAELVTSPQPYSDLLPEITSRAMEAFTLVSGSRSRMLHQIGVVTTTLVAGEEVPPGIAKLINYLGKPWGNKLDTYGVNITADVQSTPEHTDRCTHLIVKPEDPEQLTQIKFDWQRMYKTPTTATGDSLKRLTASASKDARLYFEELGEGSRFDERILDKST
jgi:hypothetical protein